MRENGELGNEGRLKDEKNWMVGYGWVNSVGMTGGLSDLNPEGTECTIF